MPETIKLKSADFKFPERLRGLLIGSSGVGKSEFLKNIIRWKSLVLPKPYSKYVYCSPNLEESFLTHEHRFMEVSMRHFFLREEVNGELF